MQTIKHGSKGLPVKSLQVALTHSTLGVFRLPITGIFDNETQQAVIRFQQAHGLVADGIVGAKTWAKLNEVTANKKLIAINAGHGGIDPKTGKYTTSGKQWRHKGANLHTPDGDFFEGVENRIIANEVARQLRELGIFVLVTHHPFEDDYGRLSMHKNAVLPFLECGYGGYMHSFHSNAISSSNTPEKLENTRGGIVYTASDIFDKKTGVKLVDSTTKSDYVSKDLLFIWSVKFRSWVRLQDEKKEITIQSDHESNFQVLRDIELAAKKYGASFGAILEEFGFMTSRADCEFITNQETRLKRIEAAVELGKIWGV